MKYSEDGKTFELDIPVGSDVYIFIGKPEYEVVAKTKVHSAQLTCFNNGKIGILYHTMIKNIIFSNHSGFKKGDTAPASTLYGYTLGENLFFTKEEIKQKMKENRKKAKK